MPAGPTALRLRWLPARDLISLGLRPASAQLLGPEFAVNSYATSHQQYAAAAADGLGNFVVVWASLGQDDPDFAGIFGQRIAALLFADGFELGDACAWSAAVGGGC